MSDEFHNDGFGQPSDGMEVVDGEKLSEPEISIRQDENAPRADAYPQADEYEQNREYYRQKQEEYRRQEEFRRQQEAYRQQQSYGQQDAYRQQNYRQQNGQPYYGQARQQKSDSIGFGIASLTLGICSLLMFCTCINYIMAVLAIIFGIIQIVRSDKKGMAIAGMITAGISMLLGIILWTGVLMAMSGQGGTENPFSSYLEQYYDQYYYDNDDGAF